MNKKSFALAAFFLLLGGVTFTAKAQSEIAVDRFPSSAVTYNVQLEGTEVFPGTADEVANTIYGWNLSGQTSGDLSGNAFLSVNYSMSPARQMYIRGPRTSTNIVNMVSGGSWSKTIYVEGVEVGTVSGTIAGGTVTWNQDQTIATLDLQLTSDNGTGDFAGLVGSGTFTGVVDRTNATPTVSGQLVLNY